MIIDKQTSITIKEDALIAIDALTGIVNCVESGNLDSYYLGEKIKIVKECFNYIEHHCDYNW